MLYFESIVVYSLLTLFMCYGAYRSQGTGRLAKLWEWIPIILFTLVFGLRYGVGMDYNNYVVIYEGTSIYTSLSEILEHERYEPAFSILLYIFHLFNAPVYWLFSFIAFLQIFLLYKTFENEKKVLLFIYLTLILTGFCMYNFMNILRHEVAFCFFLYSLKYVKNNQLLKYWICCLLALSFHHSALILFPLYFIWIKRKSLFNNSVIELTLVIICFLTSLLAQWQNILHLFDNVIVLLGYGDYIDIAGDMTINRKIGITRLFNLFINCLIILNSKKIKEYFKGGLVDIIYDLFVIGVCLGYIALGSMMMQRMFVYFTHTQFIMLAYALCYFYETRRQNYQQLFKYLAIVLFIFISYSSFIYHCEDNIGAYVFYFQTDMHEVKDMLRDAVLSQME